MDFEPPFLENYKSLMQSSSTSPHDVDGIIRNDDDKKSYSSMVHERFELPLIDLNSLLNLECQEEIAEASRKWGFFQVVNHGVSQELLETLHFEQVKLFNQPFEKKCQKSFLNLPAGSCRWGNPFASDLIQVPWSEALHVFIPDLARMDHHHKCLRSSMEAFASVVGPLAESLAEILAQKLNKKELINYFQDNCSASTSFLRLNRYPPCPLPSKVFGLLPHTDSSFLTILHQDLVGGLQFMTDNGKWVPVKPNPQALIVNIGDLFQALSNGVYKSVKHRVVAAEKRDRFSMAYFYNPSLDAVIHSNATPPLYRTFTYRQYKDQIEKDLKEIGDKVGLSRFLL